ncbi:MAG: ferritin family protein [bacterium]|nr:ferritin family protein [bacterium]
MNQSTKQKLLEGLKEAMIAERTGIEFFTVAASRTSDPKGKEVFQNLAQEEAEHLAWLKKQYAHLLNDEPLEKVPPIPVTDMEGDHPIFSKELRTRLKDAHFEMTALSVGQQLEQAAIDRYRRLAEEAGPGELRDFYLQLLEWEMSHAGAFSRAAQELREEYWAQNNFSPF